MITAGEELRLVSLIMAIIDIKLRPFKLTFTVQRLATPLSLAIAAHRTGQLLQTAGFGVAGLACILNFVI